MPWRKLLSLFGLLAVAACAQDGTTTFSSDVRVVNLFAIVRDDQGRVVHGLTRDDFALEENGHPQTIRYFSQESGLPLTLGLLVDTSISQRRMLGEERAASYRFFTQVLRPEKDRAFVIHFDRVVELCRISHRRARSWATPLGILKPRSVSRARVAGRRAGRRSMTRFSWRRKK